jgi:hypothetical protein
MVRQTDLAEQRPASLDRASVRDVRTEACELADAATNLLVLGAREGRLGKVIAQLMGHAKVDTTLNVYTQIIDGSLRRGADTVGSEMLGQYGPAWAPFSDLNLCALLWKTA